MDLEQGKSGQHLVNDYAVQEAKATLNNPVKATVTLYVVHAAHDAATFLYRVERSRGAYMLNGAHHTETPDQLTVTRVPRPGGFQPGDDVVAASSRYAEGAEHFDDPALAQRVVKGLLGPELARYFFYPGETLAFPFKDDKTSKGNMEIFLREVAGRNKFAPAEGMLKTACKRLAEKSRALSQADKATQRIQTQIDNLEREKRGKQEQLPRLQDELDAAEKNRTSVVERLEALEEFKVVTADAEAARVAEQAAQATADRAEQALSDALSNAYLCVASPIFSAMLGVFNQRRYPQDISRALVEQMRESMMCICERDLDSRMLGRLAPRSPTDDSVTSRMIVLASHAAAVQTSGNGREAVDAARDVLDEACRSRDEANRVREAAEAQLTQKEAEHIGVDKDRLVSQRASLDRDIRDLYTKIAALNGEIGQIDKMIALEQVKRREAAPGIDKAVHRADETARQMQSMLDAIARKQAEVARSHLEALIAQNYMIYKTNFRAAIDSAFRVRVYDDVGDGEFEKPLGDLSGSETALLTYAFAAAAAKLIPQYQTVRGILTTIPEFKEVENIPLVVDAPFTNLGTEYKRRVVELMTTGFSQVVMLTESTDTDVLAQASDSIGAEYVVRFEGDIGNDVEGTFEWSGQTHTYASANTETTRSTLERIEAAA